MNESKDKQMMWNIAGGIIFFGLVFLVLWKGAAYQGMGVEHQLVDFSNATIKPLQNSTFSSECKCPSGVGEVVAGAITKTQLMGQNEHEGNVPYTFNDCTHDAQDMLNLLQDEFYFKYAQSLTRSTLTDTQPDTMYYTWDQENHQCKFYLTCGGVHMCDKRSVATGMVKPTVSKNGYSAKDKTDQEVVA